jgi:hypothetical protein
MPRAGTVKTDYKGIGDVLNDPGVRADLTRRMGAVLSVARAGAPVDTGAYRDGLHIEQATTDRVVVRVSGSTGHDMFVEADTGNLARALDAAR